MDQLVIGVFGLTGCAGDQLTLLNCEEEILGIAERTVMSSFNMVTSRQSAGPLEVALVEGSVCQPGDLAMLRDIRARCRCLVALGTCASFGGIAAMDQRVDPAVLKETVYGPQGVDFEATRALPLSSFVDVDFILPGCPVEKNQLLETLSCLLKGSLPEIAATPVCAECRSRENLCLVLERSEVCCGALTRSGCGARCPTLDVPCAGCRGPVEDAYYAVKGELLRGKGIDREKIRRRMMLFSAPAGMGERLEREFD